MTVLSRLLSLFTTFIMAAASASFVMLCLSDSWIEALLSLLALTFVLYGMPLLIYRVHALAYPVKAGVSYLQGRVRENEYSAWWGSHQIQLIYIALPVLETVLRLVPGLFSAWLRLWGAKVGQGIYWAPGLELADRGLLTVGDRAIIGHRVGLYAHVIKPKKADLMLYVKPIQIGAGAFIGSAYRLGPGVIIAAGASVPVTTDLFPNQTGKEAFTFQPDADECSD